ncbi:hypothetical protein [uncultured Tolumonas sp.]|uniref:hypothetical protein n=1 Tax=uncultured Tolumonas sp. TaxID=263765 RepID=UPI002A0A137D|nr:hypothetical protein [uncultured Tolumonas sp.]
MAKKQHLIKERLSQMYDFGAEPYELSNCLKESKQKLILAGAKVDNLPRTKEKRLHLLSTLPPRARSVVLRWFRTNVQFSEQDDPTKIVNELLLNENCENKKESTKSLWRAIFGFYVSESCPEIIKQFLNDEEIKLINDEDPEAFTNSLPKYPVIDLTDEDITECLSIIQGDNISYSNRVIPMFVAGILQAVKGEVDASNVWKEKLLAHPAPIVHELEKVIAGFWASNDKKVIDYVTTSQAEPVLLSDIDYGIEDISFIGVVSKLLPSGVFFVLPIALFINDKLYYLSEEQTKALFPHNGEVVGLLNSHFPQNVTQGELGIWQATHQPSDKPAQCRLTRYQSYVYRVVRLPHLSTEPDDVRDWLLTHYHPQKESPVIFLLMDGVGLRFPGNLIDPKKYDFDLPLDSYKELTCVELGSQQITIVSQLPITSDKYDCAPASTWIKRLLKENYLSIDFPSFSKAQIQSLTHFIIEHKPNNKAYHRALTQLEKTMASREFLSDITQQLLTLPAVQSQIDLEKKAILASYENEQQQFRQAIVLLSEKKIQLEDEIEKQKKELKKALRQQENQLDLRIRQTFERASQDGVETLAQAALLRALIAGTTAGVSQLDPKAKPEQTSNRTLPLSEPEQCISVMGNEINSKKQLIAAIAKQSLVTGLSEDLLSSIVAAANVTSIVGLTGKYTKNTLSSLANIMSGGVRSVVSIHGDLFSISDLMKSPTLVISAGTTCSMTLGDYLTHQQTNGVATIVELRGFNRAPPETLLPELSDSLFSDEHSSGFCWTDNNHVLRHLLFSQPVLFVLTFAVGKSTFPLQGPMAHKLPVFLADTVWGDEQPADLSSNITMTYMTSASRQFFFTDPEKLAKHYGNNKQTMLTVLKAFGFSDERSQAIVELAFNAGRSTPEKITSVIESLSPALKHYAQEITQGEAYMELDCLFRP